MTVLTLQQLIGKLKDMPRAVLDAAMPEAVKAVDRTLRETIEQQQNPYEEPWAPREKGTRPVLVQASAALTTSQLGRTIYVVVRGINARHHKGAVRGGVQRQMIPFVKDMKSAPRRPRKGKKPKPRAAPRGIPPRVIAALHEVYTKAFKAWKAAPPP